MLQLTLWIILAPLMRLAWAVALTPLLGCMHLQSRDDGDYVAPGFALTSVDTVTGFAPSSLDTSFQHHAA